MAIGSGKKLIILLKVFQETGLIEATVIYLKRLLDAVPNSEVVIVGTERERDDFGGNATLESAQRIIGNDTRFRLFEAPAGPGTHAVQNNYALQRLDGIDPNCTWIMTMDIDSRFGSDGLSAIAAAMESGALVIQQSAVFLQNFHRLPLLEKGHAFYQSRWTICHEMKRIWLNRATGLSLAHVVGHGLCINLALLKTLGGFPEATVAEDIHLGFNIIASGFKILSIPVLEMADNPESLPDGIRQEYVWSFGAMQYPLYLAQYVKEHSGRSKRNLFLCYLFMVEALFSYFRWLVTSWVFIGLVLWSRSGPAEVRILLLFYYCEFLQCAVHFYSRKWFRLSDLLKSPLYFFLGVARRSWGADLALIDTILKRHIIKYKTPHL